MGAHAGPRAARHRRVRGGGAGSRGAPRSTASRPLRCSVREVQEGDDLPLLAAHALWALAFRAPGASPEALTARHLLTESLFLLEAAVAVSPHNAQLRLAAARVSGWLGLASFAMRHYPTLRVKHQAIDSIGHPFITQVRGGGWGSCVCVGTESVSAVSNLNHAPEWLHGRPSPLLRRPPAWPPRTPSRASATPSTASARGR